MSGLSQYQVKTMRRTRTDGLYQAKQRGDDALYAKIEKLLLDAYRRVNEQHQKTQEKENEQNRQRTARAGG